MFIYDKTGINIGVFSYVYCCNVFLHDKEGYSREAAMLDYNKKKKIVL